MFTSNIDGYFVQSGFDPERVAEAGNLNLLQCSTRRFEHSVSDLKENRSESARELGNEHQ